MTHAPLHIHVLVAVLVDGWSRVCVWGGGRKARLQRVARPCVVGEHSLLFRPLPRSLDVVGAAVVVPCHTRFLKDMWQYWCCQQVCSVLNYGITVVVSPLISLMQDQVQLVSNLGDGVSAACLFSGQPETEAMSIYRELHKPHPLIQLLFLTPERIGTGGMQEIFRKLHESVRGPSAPHSRMAMGLRSR